jgi:O-antigen ligase
MKNRYPLYAAIRSHETAVYTWLCIGIAWSLVFWTLLNSLFCIALFAYWLIFSPQKFSLASTQTRLMLLFASLYLVSVIGMLYTSNGEEGWFRLQQKSAILIFPLVFGTTSVLTGRIVNKILTHFTAATLIACAISLGYGFVRYLQNGRVEMMTYERLIIFPDLYMYIMGLFCLVSLAFLLYQWTDASAKKRAGIVAAVLFLSAYILLLSVRMIVVCWLLVILYYLFKYETSIRQRIVTALILCAALVVSFLAIPTLQKQWRELADTKDVIPLGQDASLGRSWGGKAIRVAIWECSTKLAARHWIAGVGTGDVQDSLQQSYEDARFYFASRYNRYNAHNQYLQLLIGNGFAGLFIFVLCLFAAPVLAAKHPVHPLYFIVLLLFGIISFSEVMLDVNKGVIMYSFFNSIFAFTKIKTRANDQS